MDAPVVVVDAAHGSAYQKLFTAAAASGYISMNWFAPISVSIVSTRCCTPASFSVAPAAVAWR